MVLSFVMHACLVHDTRAKHVMSLVHVFEHLIRFSCDDTSNALIFSAAITKLKQAIAKTDGALALLHGAVFAGDLDSVRKLVQTTPRASIGLLLAGQTLLHTAVLGSHFHARSDTRSGLHGSWWSGKDQSSGSTGSWWQFFRDSCGLPIEGLMAEALVSAGAVRSARNADGHTAHDMATQRLPLGVHLFRAWAAALDPSKPNLVRLEHPRLHTRD